jgi:hypothetical protein
MLNVLSPVSRINDQSSALQGLPLAFLGNCFTLRSVEVRSTYQQALINPVGGGFLLFCGLESGVLLRLDRKAYAGP